MARSKNRKQEKSRYTLFRRFIARYCISIIDLFLSPSKYSFFYRRIAIAILVVFYFSLVFVSLRFWIFWKLG